MPRGTAPGGTADGAANPDADWDRDGIVSTRDIAQYGSTAYLAALPQGQLAQPGSATQPAATTTAAANAARAANARSDFNIGFCGYRFNGDIGAYTVRFRHYDPTPGMCRWLERDPAGYQDGPSLYSYLGRNPMAGTDPYGLFYSGSGITVIAPDQIRPPVGASELVNPPGYGLRPTLLPPHMPGYNEVLAWAEALSAIARSNAERGVDYRRDQSGFSAVGAFEGLADGAILIANSFACGWVPGLNRAAEQVRTANAGSMAYTVADWSASVGTALLPIGGGVKGFNLGMKAASGGAKHRVFYSGLGREGISDLNAWAAKRGWVTIEGTLIGRAAGLVAGPLERKGWLRAKNAVWKGASWVFAKYAGKNSSVVLGD